MIASLQKGCHRAHAQRHRNDAERFCVVPCGVCHRGAGSKRCGALPGHVCARVGAAAPAPSTHTRHPGCPAEAPRTAVGPAHCAKQPHLCSQLYPPPPPPPPRPPAPPPPPPPSVSTHGFMCSKHSPPTPTHLSQPGKDSCVVCWGAQAPQTPIQHGAGSRSGKGQDA